MFRWLHCNEIQNIISLKKRISLRIKSWKCKDNIKISLKGIQKCRLHKHDSFRSILLGEKTNEHTNKQTNETNKQTNKQTKQTNKKTRKIN